MNDVALRDPWTLVDWMPRFLDVDWATPRMRVEEYREGDTLIVKADLPGIDPDRDVKISLTEGHLRIQAERREETEHAGKTTYRSEFRYGSFVRDLTIPSGVKETEIAASYRDGVLTVTVPLPQSVDHVTRIPVTHD